MLNKNNDAFPQTTTKKFFKKGVKIHVHKITYTKNEYFREILKIGTELLVEEVLEHGLLVQQSDETKNPNHEARSFYVRLKKFTSLNPVFQIMDDLDVKNTISFYYRISKILQIVLH